MPRPGRVGQKAPVVGVLQKRPIEAWYAGVRFIHACFHAVDHHAPWTTAEELECLFEAIDDGDQVLGENRNDTAQPAVAHHHHEAVNDTAMSATEFLQQAKLSKVDFGKFSRCRFDTPDRPGRLAETAVLANESVQGRIWHSQSFASEQFVDFR